MSHMQLFRDDSAGDTSAIHFPALFVTLRRKEFDGYGSRRSEKTCDNSRTVQCREPRADACDIPGTGCLRMRGYDKGRGVETPYLSVVFSGGGRGRPGVAGGGESGNGASVRGRGRQLPPCGGSPRCGRRYGVDRGAYDG